MKVKGPSLPPASSKRHQRETIILRAMVVRACFAYGGIAIVAVLFAPGILRAAMTGSLLNTALLMAVLTGLFLALGGALCAAFISQLRHWPPPGPNCVIHGRHFVWTWPWTAANILTQLAMRDVVGG